MAVISDIEIRLRADIARLQQDMNAARRSVDGAMGGITQAAQQARNALGGIAAGIGLSQLAGLVDQYVKFTSQLKLATQSQREYNTAYADVKRIAAGSTQGLQETGILYARIANGTRELGVSQKQLSDVVETVNLSLLVSGATASEAASAQLQLSQAFASGTLRGEEFNSVNEAAPRLMKALADGIGVPVGALKKMAEEGLITSEIMANVLPRALVTLREEAKNIQTISGSFTLLKNSAMEFVGSTAQASGAVTAISSLLSGLANNLNLVAGALLTVVAVKIANFFDVAIARTIAAVAANNALIASNLATAKAEFAAANAADFLAGARLNEVRAATLAASGNVQLALTTNGLIPAQNRAAVTSLALSASYFGLQGALAGATLATRALNAALAFTGGPLGLIITLLGVAATAWGFYEYSQNKANEKAAADTKASAGEITENLSKVNAMLRERIALQNAGASDAVTGEGTGSQELRDTLRDINELKAKGAALDASDQIRLISLQGIYNALNKEIEDNVSLKRETEANGQIAKDVVTVRERLNGVNQQYIKDLGVLKSALDKGAISQGEYTQLVSKLASETYKSSDAYKEAKTNAEKAAKASKDQAEAYRDLIYSLQERVAVTEREVSGLRPLNDAEKAHLDLTKQITNGKLKLSASQQGRARSLIDEARANDVLAASNKEYAELQETLAKAAKDLAAERMSLIDSARQDAEQNELAIKTFGMTEAAIIRLTASRLMDQEAQRLGRQLTEEEIADLNRVIALKERSAVAVASRAELEKVKTFWTDIEKTAHDTFVSIADGGKGAFQRLKETAKNTFFDWLYQQTLKKWIINIGTSVTGAGVAGAAQAASGGIGSVSGIASLIGSVKGIGSGALQTAGAVLTGQAGLGSTISAGFSALASGTASGITAGLSSLAGTLGPIALGIAGAAKLLSSAFGRGPKELTGNSKLTGSLTAAGFAGSFQDEWKKKGGWFSSSKTGFDSRAVGNEVSMMLDTTYDAIKTSSADYARMLGLNADAITNRTQSISIAMGKDEAANQKAIADFFTGVANTVAGELLPEISKFQIAGEEASSTLQRLATNYAGLDQVLALMGTTSQKAFGAVGVASIEARERLIAFAGGLEALASQTTFFNQNFLSQSEQIAIVQKPLNEALANLGYAGITTADQFKTAVLSLSESGALATAEGAKTYAGLLALAPAFKTVSDYLKELTDAASEKALADAAAAQQQAEAATSAALAIAISKRGLEIEIMELAGDTAGALAARRQDETAAADASLGSLLARKYALEDEAVAAQAAAEAAAQAASIATSRRQLEIQLMELSGDALGALAARRDDEVNANDASLAAMYRRIYALQDEKTAADASAAALNQNQTLLKDAVSSALTNLTSVVNAQKSAASSAYQATMASFSASIESVNGRIKELSDLASTFRGAMVGVESDSQTAGSRAAAKAQITAALAIAKASGVLPSPESLADAFAAINNDASDQFSTLAEYQRDVAKTNSELGALAGLSGKELTMAEQQLRSMESSRMQAEANYSAEIGRLDALLATGQAQVDAVNGVDTRVMTLAGSIALLATSIQAMQQGATPSNPGGSNLSLEQLYKTVLGRAPDEAGYAFWKKAYGDVIDSTEYADFIKAAQPELDAQERMRKQGEAATMSGNGRQTYSEVGVSPQSGQSMIALLERVANSNEQLASQFNKVSGGGNSLLTEPA